MQMFVKYFCICTTVRGATPECAATMKIFTFTIPAAGRFVEHRCPCHLEAET